MVQSRDQPVERGRKIVPVELCLFAQTYSNFIDIIQIASSFL